MAEANKHAWGSHVVAKFIIKKPYGTKGNCYPTGTIVFSTAIIRYSKGTEIISKTSQRVYRNGAHKNHAEKKFIKVLDDEIDELQQSEVSVNEIIVNLVQNYSPCRSICVKKIINFKTKMEAQNIESSWTIKFANFYKIYYKRGKEKWKGSSEIFGLVDLLENGVTLQLLGGEQDWEEFLNKYVDPNVKTRGLQLARSSGRKQREKHDTEIFAYINTRVSAGEEGANTEEDGGELEEDGGESEEDGGELEEDGGESEEDGGESEEDGGESEEDGGQSEKMAKMMQNLKLTGNV